MIVPYGPASQTERCAPAGQRTVAQAVVPGPSAAVITAIDPEQMHLPGAIQQRCASSQL